MRDHSSYTPAVLKTCKELYNLKCQFTKKRNKITIIATLLSTLVVKREQIHRQYRWIQIFKICTGWIIFKICLRFLYPAVYFSEVPRTCLGRRAWHIVISRPLDIYGLFKVEFDCLWVVVDVFEVVVDGCCMNLSRWLYMVVGGFRWL